MPLTLRVYKQALRLYPAAFRRAFGTDLWQTCRDAYEEASARGSGALALLWLHLGADILRSALPERLHAMRPTLVLAPVLTGIAFFVSLLASLNLYGLEDQNPLTVAAYQASPFLRVSYDGIYLSALVAGVAVCAILAYAIAPANGYVTIGLAMVALLIALGGFGGLLVRSPATFLILFVVFIGLTLVSFLSGRAVAVRLQPRLGPRAAAILGGCVSAGVVLLINMLAVVSHTLVLNPVSHTLYMQGQIAGTHYNALLLVLGGQVLTMLVCLVSILLALRATMPTAPRNAG